MRVALDNLLAVLAPAVAVVDVVRCGLHIQCGPAVVAPHYGLTVEGRGPCAAVTMLMVRVLQLLRLRLPLLCKAGAAHAAGRCRHQCGRPGRLRCSAVAVMKATYQWRLRCGF